MNRNYLSLLLLIFVFGCVTAKAQKRPKKVRDSTKNHRLTILPVVFFLPETGLGYGALGLSTFRLKGEPRVSRPSNIQLGITFTSKNQMLLFMPYEIYSDHEKWRFIGELGYYQYFYNFFGRGINSQKEDLETYDADFPRVRFSALREVLPNISVGAGYEFDGFNVVNLAPNGLLDSSNEIGKDGGTISNLGITAFFDNRDNIFAPTKGIFVQSSFFSAAKFLGSSFSYTKFEFDSRFYQQLKGKHIMAANLYLSTRSKGTPFLDLNSLGSKRTRGHENRRYQDNTELSLAVEYRFPISGRFAGVAFVSTGTVTPNVGDAFSSAYKNAAGGGIRYILNRKEGTRIRVDYGLSSEGGQFYFTINEAF